MQKLNLLVGAIAALSLLIVPVAFARDVDTDITRTIDTLDASQGSGVHTDNSDDLQNALSGSGSQSSYTGRDANTGSGSQDNSRSVSDGWQGIGNANGGSGTQLVDSQNSSGRDRISSDIVMTLGDGGVVANGALESSVTGNTVHVVGQNADANSSLEISNDAGFENMAGVNAIALSSGANSSQNVSVNVTASVTATAE